MKLVFMVEERSMKELLDVLLPQILPNGVRPLILSHNGKRDLELSIPKKLNAWPFPDDKFIIVHDKDSNDCMRLKSNLLSLCQNSRNDCLVRIVCTELESWYLGDLAAVSLAYDEDFTVLSGKSKFRDPDKLGNAKQELRKLVPAYQPISGTRKISLHMDASKNTSPSFNVFVSGIRKMCCT